MIIDAAHPRPAELSDERIAAVVDAFYARVRDDAQLAPVFGAAVDDWDEHLVKLSSFWCSILFAAGTYKGNPMIVHRKHAASITRQHFSRWLTLWRETTSELLSPESAARLQAKAERMAAHLQQGIPIAR